MIFLKGLLFGLTLQLAIGPVCIANFNRSISKGFLEAFKMAWGVALVDFFYILLSIVGMGAILRIDFVRWPVLIIGSVVLIYIGVKHIIPSKKEEESIEEEKDKNSFVYGIKLTIPNTITIVFWANVFGSLIASHKLVGTFNTFAFGLGCAFSAVMFLTFISFVGSSFSTIFNDKVKRYINVFVGLFLIYFAISMLFIKK